VHSAHGGKRSLGEPTFAPGAKRLTADEAFVIRHFAGNVLYETEGFLHKNNDTIHDGLLQVLAESAAPFVTELVPPSATEEEKGVAHGPQGGRFKSVSKRFSTQLGSLMGTLYSTNSHFVRCIKPNQQQRSGVLDRHAVMTQLRYSGMCAALLLMQAGFPTRVSFEELYHQYAPRMPAMLRALKPMTFCESLLVALELDGGR
jgi:myosin-6